MIELKVVIQERDADFLDVRVDAVSMEGATLAEVMFSRLTRASIARLIDSVREPEHHMHGEELNG